MTATKTNKSLKLACPKCGIADCAIDLNLNDLDSITCSECTETFSAAEAVKALEERLAAWSWVMGWVELAKNIAAE